VSDPRRPSTLDRDQAITGFSRHLDGLLAQLPEALCAVFVDPEGETVDVSARVDPFDARVAGAEMAIVLGSARAASRKLGYGDTLEVRLESPQRSVIVRAVSEGYELVLLVGAPAISARAAELVAQTAVALLTEAGLPPPPSYATLRSVERKPSQTGMLVPAAFDDRGVRRKVTAVLGHRTEGGAVKFLVRVDTGEELLLVNEPISGRWTRG
jgi:predicted regulator of Ras-like GTPase activity (Roadblock/LC7/MglB family)